VVADTKQLGVEGQDGLNRLYRQYAVWLRRRLRARIGADAAADVVQETYIRAAPYALANIRHPKAFLLRIAMNLLRDESRRQGRHQLYTETAAAPESEAASQIDALLLSEMIRSMPALYRNVFVLNRFGGMTYPEIARTLDISVKTVEWRMARALEYCASRLDL
jgi:RNA polymerase sigma factor (sigma-70 family)